MTVVCRRLIANASLRQSSSGLTSKAVVIYPLSLLKPSFLEEVCWVRGGQLRLMWKVKRTGTGIAPKCLWDLSLGRKLATHSRNAERFRSTEH